VGLVHGGQPGTLSVVPQTDPADLPAPSPFDAATAVHRAEGGGLTATLDPGWDVGGDVLNGGYLLAVAARAAVLDSPHPHAVALSASYLRATGPGPATLTVTPGPAGRTLAHALVTLGDPAGPSLSVQVTTATLGGDAPVHSSAMPHVPPVQECLAADAGARLGGRPVPPVGLRERVETRLDPATAGWVTGRPSGEPVMRAWVRLAGGREPDPLALVLFADVLPPTSWAIGRYGWAPTVQLQVLVRALPAPGWCLVEARAGEVAGGWLDEDYRIWDSTGRLVAQSRQLARAPRG
jgi:acyl-Coa thioesterase superfamily protein/acyl-CoA thioesterase superfamily protein